MTFTAAQCEVRRMRGRWAAGMTSSSRPVCPATHQPLTPTFLRVRSVMSVSFLRMARVIPCRRHSSPVSTPASDSFSTAMICSSLNRLLRTTPPPTLERVILNWRSHISNGLVSGGHIWTHPVCKGLDDSGAGKRRVHISGLIHGRCFIFRALMESALLLLIRSTALKGPAPRRF